MERLARLILYLPLCVYASSALEGGRSAFPCDCDDLSSPTEIRVSLTLIKKIVPYSQ